MTEHWVSIQTVTPRPLPMLSYIFRAATQGGVWGASSEQTTAWQHLSPTGVSTSFGSQLFCKTEK